MRVFVGVRETVAGPLVRSVHENRKPDRPVTEEQTGYRRIEVGACGPDALLGDEFGQISNRPTADGKAPPLLFRHAFALRHRLAAVFRYALSICRRTAGRRPAQQALKV